MFCKSCGKAINDSVKFCPECGATVNGEAQTGSAVHTPPPAAYPQYPSYPQNSQNMYAKYKKPGSGWITGMRIVSWILFCTIILAGLISGIQVMRYSAAGLLIIIGSVIVAFLTVAWTMIILGMAYDISAIRRNTER